MQNTPKTMMSYLYVLLLVFLQTVAAATPPAYTATDLILLNCGESRNASIDVSNRSWDGDAAGSGFLSSNTASRAIYAVRSVPVPYRTARLSRSPFTYSFPVSPGRKFVRLHFNTEVDSGFDPFLSLFSLTTTNSFTLLNNFSPSVNSNRSLMLVKEFVVSVGEKQRLNLTFSPNPNSFAFVNGIEIVSMPDNLYFQGKPIKFGNGVFYLKNDTALETLYRLNVGGGAVDIQNDSGMFRRWLPDDDYIHGSDDGYTPQDVEAQVNYSAETPPYSAPAIVYSTARVAGNPGPNLGWNFQVDSGFNYLLRLHYCDFTFSVRGMNQDAFTVNINENDSDIFITPSKPDTPVFKDYIGWAANDGRRGKQDLRLSLYYREFDHAYYDSAMLMLNGLEMFKLSNPSRSLAANPELTVGSPLTPPSPRISGGSSVVYVVIGSVIGGAAVVGVSFLILRRRWRKAKAKSPRVSLPSDLCRCFSIKEIKTATDDFDDNFVIGRGGFGNVYKGLIDAAAAATTVAIKRLNPSSDQGAREFLTEIEMLSKLRHLHLVSLIGYCDDGGEMILVYDYLPHGTLRDHLYNSNNPPLPWIQRLQICLGAAKGLDYLHTCTKNSIIHRDVKTTNILIDQNWIAKVSDFGLSKVGAAGIHNHVSTAVKGSFGYMDPEYYRRQQLTNKSDVYSFGVVLFEVLCARPAVLPSLPLEQASLAEWAKFCYRESKIEQIIDSNLKSQIAPECLSTFVETAVACLGENGIDRPSMNDVVRSLEIAIELQLSADGNCAVSQLLPLLGDEEVFSKCSEIAASKNSDFSEIINPTGR